MLEKYLKLKKEIEKYNYYYYEKNESLVSDVEFDNLLKELEQMEKEYPELKNIDSPTENVGGSINEKFKKIKHNKAMLSLANSYNIEDIKEFDARVKKIVNKDVEYILELKLDGLSIDIQYENGKLIRALTRGDGVYGEDVTDNILMIKNIPYTLKENVDIEVRGEIILPISEFNKLNEEREQNGETVFSNPRNAASGTIRQLDSNIVSSRNLKCYIYYVVNNDDFDIYKHEESIKLIEKLGFETTKIFEKYTDILELEKAIFNWDTARKKLDYETDGLVLKVNDMTTYEMLGYTAKSPRWAIAYKFKPEQIETKIISVDFQVGRTGVITPVANFEAVNLSGSIVKRASIHNFDEIKRKDIRLYDTVVIEKAAEIIPQVVNVVFSKRTGEEQIISVPERCPSCNQKTYSFDDIVAIKCLNPYCEEQLTRYIQYFVSRDCMNIVGLGEKITRKLINLGFITSILDIYNLKSFKEELIKLDKMGDKNINNLLNSIENSKKNTFNRIIFSLGIPYIGKTTANIICEHFNNIDNLINAKEEDFLSIKGIGEKATKSIIKYFENTNNKRIVNALKEIGFKLENEEKIIKNNEFITGKNFLATGTLNNFKREEIKEIITSYGGNYLSTVSKKLDYLIVGENAGSKLEKANKLGIKILSELEFLKMLES